MDGNFHLNIREVLSSIDRAEVISMYFPLFRKALLIDVRCDNEEGPLIQVVPMVNSIEDRYRSLRRLRPRFSRPEGITVIPWPKYVSSLETLGIWEHIVKRLVDAGYREVIQQCHQCLAELHKHEERETTRAIVGEHYHTLWEKKG